MAGKDIEKESSMSASTKRFLIVTIGSVVLLFLGAFLLGYGTVAFRHGVPSVIDFVTMAVGGALIAATGFAMRKFWPSSNDEPVAESTRKSTNIIYVMIGIGAVLGMLLGVADPENSMILFSNEPLDGLIATLALIVWVLIVPLLTWIWWRVVDEHEASAYTFGALISAHVYMIATPVWWVAWRAGWLPEQDPMIMFLTIAGLWSAIWMYRRYF